MSAPKYRIGDKVGSGTIVGVIDHGESRAPHYLLDTIEGPVEERDVEKLMRAKPAKKEEPSATGESPAAE